MAGPWTTPKICGSYGPAGPLTTFPGRASGVPDRHCVRKTNTCSLTTKNIIEGINIIAMLLLQSRRTSLGCHCEKSCCIANTIQIQTHNAFRSLASCVRSRSSQALNIGGLFTRYFGTSRVDFKSRDFPAATGAQGRAAGPCGAAQRSAHTRSKWAGQD